MRCPLCLKGCKPDTLWVINDRLNKEIMDKEYTDLDKLQGHLVWSHPSMDVVDLLIKYMKRELEK